MQKTNSSFIPKKFLKADVQGASSQNKFARHGASTSPGYALTLIILLVTILIAIIFFGYLRITDAAISKSLEKLEADQEKFDEQLIEEYVRLDARMRGAQDLVANHVLVTEVASLLEAITLQDITYTSVVYGEVKSGKNRNARLQPQITADGEVPLTISGIARDFQSVALQVDQFQESEFLHNAAVTELKKEKDGNTVFSITALVDPRLTTYSAALQRGRMSFSRSLYEAPSTRTQTTGSETDDTISATTYE